MNPSVLDGYDPQEFYCEMLRGVASRAVRERLAGLSIEALKQRAANANAELFDLGITFTVYSDSKTIDRILPFDVIPRVLSGEECQHIANDIVNQLTLINLLLDALHPYRHVFQ